nr:transposase [Actinokineospora spheciospongiae]
MARVRFRGTGPGRPTRGRPSACERTVHRRRNVFERCFDRLKQFRAIATRYDRTATSLQGTIDLTTLTLWL